MAGKEKGGNTGEITNTLCFHAFTKSSLVDHSPFTTRRSSFPILLSSTAMTKPNIVLIVADDMGYGDLDAFNDGPARTPSLDHLVDESLCLTQHYSGSPVCLPARAALLTGRYPIRTGAITPQEVMGLDRMALREVTIADAFKQAAARYVELDIEHKYHPENVTEISGNPDPERIIPDPPPPELYHIEDDPLEQTNLAETEPMRTARMLNALETWFDEVESERRRFSINK